MNDRELLELAAKAAGLHIIKHCQESRDKAGYGYVGLYVRSNNGEIASTGWNPLTDDGDALRLAVMLQITIGPENPDVIGKSLARASWRNRQCSLGDYGDGDKFAATRRAIVRAAAEIGSQMK